MAYGGSQARSQLSAVATSLYHSHSNTGSFTHWARPGIKPVSSWTLVRFIAAEPQWELPQRGFFLASRLDTLVGTWGWVSRRGCQASEGLLFLHLSMWPLSASYHLASISGRNRYFRSAGDCQMSMNVTRGVREPLDVSTSITHAAGPTVETSAGRTLWVWRCVLGCMSPLILIFSDTVVPTQEWGTPNLRHRKSKRQCPLTLEGNSLANRPRYQLGAPCFFHYIITPMLSSVYFAAVRSIPIFSVQISSHCFHNQTVPWVLWAHPGSTSLPFSVQWTSTRLVRSGQVLLRQEVFLLSDENE